MTTTSQTDLNTNSNAFSNGGGGTATIDGGEGASAETTGKRTTMTFNVGGNKCLNISSSSNKDHNGGSNNLVNNTNKTNLNNGLNSGSGGSGGDGFGSNNRSATDTAKRKKLKSRNANVPNSSYSKDHLDAWLETCVKDASSAQLSSSSEFLDYNPTMNTTPAAKAAATNFAKNVLQYQANNSTFAGPSHNSSSPQNYSHISHQPHNQHHHSTLRSNNQASPLAYPSGHSAAFNLGFQRSLPNFLKHSNSFNHRSVLFPHSGYGAAGGSVGGGYFPQNDGSQDFASLPPIVNMMGASGGGISEHENSTDVLDGSGSNPNMSRGFRFSDPCLLNPSDNDSKMSEQNTPDRRNHVPTEMENNKFFAALMEQINILQETNSKICRNLHETKGAAYTPGMMTDVVREVKEAARVREDAMLNRLKVMVEERQWSTNESNLRLMREIEQLKAQVHHLRVDRKEVNKRISHLEAENKYMRQMIATFFSSRNAPDIIYENEALRSRKQHYTPSHHSRHAHHHNPQHTHLHYGTIHHQSPATAMKEEREEPLHIVETPSMTSTADVASVSEGGVGMQQRKDKDLHNSYTSDSTDDSIDSVGNGVGLDSGVGAVNNNVAAYVGDRLNNLNKSSPTTASATSTPCKESSATAATSPPNFALVSTPSDSESKYVKKDKIVIKRSDNEQQLHAQEEITEVAAQELRHELNEAKIARQEADDRIIALENLVKNLHLNANRQPKQLTNGNTCVMFGGGNGDSEFPHNTNQINQTTHNSKWLHHQQHHLQHHHHHHRQQQQQHSTNQSTSKAYILQTAGAKQHQALSTISTSVDVAQSQPKLSIAGPITDL